MDRFKHNYEKVLQNAGGVSGTAESYRYVSEVEKTIDEATEAIRREASHRSNVSEDYLKGWLAEQWHAETLKVSAQARGRSDVWAKVEGSNRPGEDIYYGDDTLARVAEVKYYRSAEDTAKAVSRPEYEGRTKIVPSDQKEAVHDTAERLSLKNQNSRPEQAAQYKDTSLNADDSLQVGNAKSSYLEEDQAKQMARDFKSEGDADLDIYGLNPENYIEWSDILRQSGEAALHAAALSAAISAAPHIWDTVSEYLEYGDIDLASLTDSGKCFLHTTAHAGLRGGVAAGLTAACKSGLLGSSLKSIPPSAVGIATTMALNTIEYSIQLQQGTINQREFAHRCMRDTFVLSMGMTGATVGQLAIPIPVLGALAGNIVGATLGAVAYEGTNYVVMGLCAQSGWTFFGLVEQDYEVPEDILKHAGYDLFTQHSFSTESFSVSDFSVGSFSTNSLNIRPVRRGIVSCCAIGYF